MAEVPEGCDLRGDLRRFSCHPGEEEMEKSATKFLACCHHKKAIYDEYMCYRSAVKCVTKKCNTSLQSFV